MPTLPRSRFRPSLAFGLVLALLAAMLTIGINPSSAAASDYATVSDHAGGGNEENDPTFWCANGWKVDFKEGSKPSTYVLPDDADPKAEGTQSYLKVIVKAGSDQSTDGKTNTIFAEPPSAGQIVWADSNPDFQYGEGDKSISHIIFCPREISAPKPGNLKAVKKWNVDGVEGDPAGTPGTLTFNDDEVKWDTSYEYPAGDTVTVTEAGNGTAPNVEGYKCTLDTGATTYQVGDKDASKTPPNVTIASDTLVTVTITNTANCEEIKPPATTLVVTKAWVYNGTPVDYPVLSSANAGSLTVTVGGVATGQAWNATQADLKVGDKFTVTEGTVPVPPQVEGYTCEISGSPAYSVNGGAFVSPAPTGPLAPSPNTVVVQNTVNCTADEVVGGIEEGGETPDEAPDGGTVGGTEDELAATGANLGPAGLGLLLILSGAALLGGRRFATR